MRNRNRNSTEISFGGLMAALGITAMSMGTLIPVATFVCPVLCMLLLQLVLKTCGRRIAWAWYGAVAILSLLLAPDKEAAVVFLYLGYYPIVKPCFDRQRGKLLWKLLFFNLLTCFSYWLMLNLLGFAQLQAEFRAHGLVFTGILLVLANVTFLLLDHLLGRRTNSSARRKGNG